MSDSRKKFLSLEKERIKNSNNYRNGQFQNFEKTEVMGYGSFFKILKAFANKPKDTRPVQRLPTSQIDFKSLDENKNAFIWFGHSSYFIQVNRIKILVDPVFSGHASPFPFMVKSFEGSDILTAAELPAIDYLLLTHDHYDHLDFTFVKNIGDKVTKIVCSLGVGKHLVQWGIDPAKITELDWWEQFANGGVSFTAVPARHFSGRGLRRMQSLWSAFVLQCDTHKFFLGGDSGYGTHFRKIAKEFNGFDFAFLEAGQYNELWSTIHMMPEETVQAALELGAKVLVPVHWGKFSLALHSWKDPIERVIKAAENKPLRVCTPKIGELVLMDETFPENNWWRSVV